MKKLIIGAAVAAISIGAFASCDDNSADCVAWDLSLSLKSLDAKKLSCKNTCGDKGTVYYLDNGTRKLKGYVWVCGDPCSDDSVYVVLWDTKKKIPVIAAPPRGNYADLATFTVGWQDFIIYGKKGNKVAGSFDIVDPDGENINVKASGLNGSLKLGCSDCYVKSLSGQAAGDIALGNKWTYIEDTSVGGLCGDKPVVTCDDPVALDVYYLTLCDVCCGFEGWCNEIGNDQGDIKTVESDLNGMVPAYGSWKIKYNKKMSKNSNVKSIWDYIPGYAL